ncbi:hypothetical protein HK102_007543 [Quaeritorhiza haematococci]|nr:hypothetical protein HK102_007543 [Quaeritorhiza haematococci]
MRVSLTFTPLLLLLLLLLGSTAAQQQTCLQSPQSASCADFTYPPANITADLTDLCTQMPFMPGCSLKNLCEDAAAKGLSSVAGSNGCQPFALLGGVCKKDMPRMRGCAGYSALCNANGSVVGQCTQFPPLPEFPTTDLVRNQVLSICTEMTMDGCEKCRFATPTSYPDCDLLSVYSQLCIAMPNMYQCAEWKTFCSAGSNSQLPYCGGSSSPSSSTTSTSGGSSILSQERPPVMKMYFHNEPAYVLFSGWVPRTPGDLTWSFFLILAIGLAYEGIVTIRTRLEFKWAELDSESDNLNYNPTSDTKRRNRRLLVRSYDWINLVFAGFRFVETLISYSLMLAAMSFNVVIFFAVICSFALGSAVFRPLRPVGNARTAAAGLGKEGPGCCG